MTGLRILSRASTPILGALLVLSALFGFARANDEPFRWAVYYGADAPSDAFADDRMVVFDSDRHPDIEPIAARRTQVLGYLSIGEVHRTRSYFAEVEREGLLVYENPNWPGAFAVENANARRGVPHLVELNHRRARCPAAAVATGSRGRPVRRRRLLLVRK